MRELLGEKDNRRLHLIESIYLSPGIDLNVVANRLGYSVMQTQLDIGFLNEIIAPLSIETNKDRKCYLEIPESLSSRVIYSKILQQNINFKVLEALLLKDYGTYDQMAEALYLSVATLKRVIIHINACFEKHEVVIKTRPLRIEGNEHNIRAFFLFYLNERYIDDVLPLPISIQSFASELVYHYSRKFPDSSKSYAGLRRLKYYVSVALLREVKMIGSPKEHLHSGSLKQLIEEDVRTYNNSFLFHQVFKFELTHEVYTSLFNYYLNDFRAFSIRDLKERVLKSQLNKTIYNQVSDTIDMISNELEIPVINKDTLYFKLYNLMIVSHRISITPYAIYPNRKIFLLFNKVIPKEVLRIIREIYNTIFSDITLKNESYFYEFIYILVTHWEGFYTHVSKRLSLCKIGLFFNSDTEHMQYIKEDLEFQFSGKVSVELINVASLMHLESVSTMYDLLIVNFIIPNTLNINTRVISVTDALWLDKQNQIQAAINDIYYFGR